MKGQDIELALSNSSHVSALSKGTVELAHPRFYSKPTYSWNHIHHLPFSHSPTLLPHDHDHSISSHSIQPHLLPSHIYAMPIVSILVPLFLYLFYIKNMTYELEWFIISHGVIQHHSYSSTQSHESISTSITSPTSTPHKHTNSMAWISWFETCWGNFTYVVTSTFWRISMIPHLVAHEGGERS